MRVLADPEIYRLELDRIFTKTWQLVAHETEIPQPGDFVTRRMGNDQVIVARDIEEMLYCAIVLEDEAMKATQAASLGLVSLPPSRSSFPSRGPPSFGGLFPSVVPSRLASSSPPPPVRPPKLTMQPHDAAQAQMARSVPAEVRARTDRATRQTYHH